MKPVDIIVYLSTLFLIYHAVQITKKIQNGSEILGSNLVKYKCYPLPKVGESK